ncbi:UNVERIFIED_CONTAM: D-amino-acid transaminase, chloroplastic [Sesamum radiatum]|uniref:D-amino-acid transaminase, chloroplastic n=1 Tax=Sesamum radiatum TaxID=300843 RepID=A0AAW2KY24_SESRA
MASLITFTSPISRALLFPSKFTACSLDSSPVSKNLAVSRNGSAFRPVTASAVTNSSQIQFPTETESAKVSAVPILSCSEAIERLRTFREVYGSSQQFLAMYSSIFGGITTDPTAMVIPMDDHMVHRGHGVFDTAAIFDGYLYELDQHIDRFLRSSAMAKIKPPFDRESIRSILIQTVSASKCTTGSLRYWLSPGPGDFQLSPAGCLQSSFYAIVIKGQSLPSFKGVKVVTSSVPIKPPQFASVKSVNYLPNALLKMEAEENDAFVGIWLDEDGYIAEGPTMNVAFVSKEKELLMPQFDKILCGCTAKRILTLAQGLVKEGKLKGIRLGDLAVEEGKRAAEMMLVGSGILVCPVVQWDDQVIGDGNEGPVAQALYNLVVEDMKSGPATVRVPVPY